MGDNRNAFTEIEEAFFQAGEQANRREATQETFADLDEGYQPKPLWRRLFARKATES